MAVGLSLDTPIERCMTANPATVEPGAPIDEAVLWMEEGGYRHLPVVDDSGRPVGVLSVKRIVHYLVEHFPSTIYCLPPDPNVFPRQREGA